MIQNSYIIDKYNTTDEALANHDWSEGVRVIGDAVISNNVQEAYDAIAHLDLATARKQDGKSLSLEERTILTPMKHAWQRVQRYSLEDLRLYMFTHLLDSAQEGSR
jgi:hypothetical protein